MEVSPTRSNWYCSTSRTSSGSFPASLVTFHVPRHSFCRPGPVNWRHLLSLPPWWHCTRPRWLAPQVVGPRDSGREVAALSLRAVPDRAPRQARPPGARCRALRPGLAPDGGSGIPPARVLLSSLLVYSIGVICRFLRTPSRLGPLRFRFSDSGRRSPSHLEDVSHQRRVQY